MINRGLSKLGLRLLDKSTDVSPSIAPKVFQRAFLGILGSSGVYRFYQTKYRSQWARMTHHPRELRRPTRGRQKILVIVDVCIGDAVLWAQCLPLLSQRFPSAEVHYLCNSTGGELIENNPNGVVVHNFMEGSRGFLSDEDRVRLRALLRREHYSLVLNLSPFLSRRSILKSARDDRSSNAAVIQLIMPYTSYAIRAWKLGGERHVSLLARRFITEFFGIDEGPDTDSQLNSNAVYLTRDNIARANEFLASHGLTSAPAGFPSYGGGLVFLNPDATSQYGRIPFEVQCRLLKDITNMDEGVAVLIGKAYSDKDVELRLIESLPLPLRTKVVVVPPMPIGAYTALIDRCDMFISGDTGPLHIASCRKVAADVDDRSSTVDDRSSTNKPMRNRTAVLAIYGATDSRMYGYDSTAPCHAPANQDAPSRSFSGPTPCRNITCINKFGKSCGTVRCFDGLPVDEISHYISSYFHQLRADNGRSSTMDDRSSTNGRISPIVKITLPAERAHAL